jgi:superoxide dismutase, Cu-Zn family
MTPSTALYAQSEHTGKQVMKDCADTRKHLTFGGTVRRITKAALGGLAGCALILGASQAANGAQSGLYKFTGALTDMLTDDGPFDSARGKTTITETKGGTTFAIRVTGIDSAVAGKEFGGHLHIGPCDPLTNKGHYKSDPTGLSTPPNEVWFNFLPNEDGMAYAVSSAPFVPVDDDGQMSIVIHTGHASDPTSISPKQACFPLEVSQWKPVEPSSSPSPTQ